MVKVRGRQRHPGCSNSDVVTHSSSKAGQSPSASIAPGPFVFIPPSTIAQMLDLTAMRPAAPLAPAFGSLEPDHRRKLRPVDRIKPFVLGADRHRAFQRRDDFAPIRQTRLIHDSRQRGGELFHETASSTLWLTEAAARANEKTPGREARGPALSCVPSNFPPRNLTFPATKLDVPKDRAKLRLATPAFCVNAWASVVLAIHSPQFAQASDPVGEIYSGGVILRLVELETSDWRR